LWRRGGVVISSHDIDLIYEICDAVYVLRRGEVLAYGTRARFLPART
jgi:ABC-type multidrug transport system ATPase subunit